MPYAWPFPKTTNLSIINPIYDGTNQLRVNKEISISPVSYTKIGSTNSGSLRNWNWVTDRNSFLSYNGNEYGFYYSYNLCSVGECTQPVISGYDKWGATTTYAEPGAYGISFTLDDRRLKLYNAGHGGGQNFDDHRLYACAYNKNILIVPNPPIRWYETIPF
jgi:hypothetical protein